MTLTTSLLNDIRDDVQDRLDTILTHGAVGTDDTAPAASDTTLGAEVERNARSSVDKSTDNIIVASLEIASTEANGNTIQEAGWFNDATSGTMWLRTLVNDINKTSDVQLFLDTQITITVTDTS